MIEHQVELLRHVPFGDVRFYRGYADACRLSTPLSELQRLRHEIQAGHVPALLRQIHRVHARAATDIKRRAPLTQIRDLGQIQSWLVVSPRQLLPVIGPLVNLEEIVFLMGAHHGHLGVVDKKPGQTRVPF